MLEAREGSEPGPVSFPLALWAPLAPSHLAVRFLHFFGFSDLSRGRHLAIDFIRFNSLPIPAAIPSKGQAMTQKSGSTPARGAMTPAAAARIQSGTAPSNGGKTPAGSFPARAQSAAARNVGGGKK